MGVRVREKTIEELQVKIDSMNSDLNRITYLESALLESGFSFEVKRFIYGELTKYYEDRKMFDRAAKNMALRAGIEVMTKEKVESFLAAAELFARAGKVEDADDMFIRAIRDSPAPEQARVKLARKNIYMKAAKDLEEKGKNASSSKFYERLIKMNLESTEKEIIKSKLIRTYNALGLFHEAKLMEGL